LLFGRPQTGAFMCYHILRGLYGHASDRRRRTSSFSHMD
jgi:hypothetical protein